MSFQPIVPIGGYAGWRFLNTTLEAQQAAHAESPVRQRDTEYFAENIGKIETAEQLVADRRLLGVALGAFGLDDDIDNKYFIQKVLSDGIGDSDALANRLADKRYLKFATAFGFGNGILPRTGLSDFPDEILTQYQERQFEISIGEQDESMRLALSARRELAELTSEDTSDSTRWFTMMGNPPLRQVFETALGLPSSFGALDLDKQLEVFRDKANSRFGSPDMAQFADPEKKEDLIKLYLLRSQIENGLSSQVPGSTALQLLGLSAG